MLFSQKKASQFYFTNINSDSGLSENNVNAIIQDSRGFMWFGTKNRLNRYDGISIKVFDCYDPILNKRNNNVSSLYEDDNRQLWIGTDKGVFIYNPEFESFSFFNDTCTTGTRITDWISDIRSDNDGNIWIIAPNQGLFRYNTGKKKLFRYFAKSVAFPIYGNPQSLYIEQDGRIWIGTNGDGVHLYNKYTDTFTRLLGNKNGSTLTGENIYTLCDYGEELLIGIHEGELKKLNKKTNTLTIVDSPEVHRKIIRSVDVFEGDIWVGTQAGLFIIDEGKRTTLHIKENTNRPHALSDNTILKIYRDRENGIWIATSFGGVDYLPERGMQFERYLLPGSPEVASSIRFKEIKEDKKGNIWIASENEGIYIFRPEAGTFDHLDMNSAIPLYDNKILSLFFEEDRVWVGFFKNGLDIIDFRQNKTTHYSAEDLGLNEASICKVFEDKNGKIWIGNSWGIFTGDKSLKKFVRQDAFGLSFVQDIAEDTEGNIWVSTMGNGIFKYNPETRKTIHYLYNDKDPNAPSSNSVSSITKDNKENLWFSTDRGGICRYDPHSGGFSSFSVECGFPDDMAYKILEDRNGYIWFGTNKGLVRFDPEKKEVKVFDKNGGLPNNQFNSKSAFASSSGRFYFGTLGGLVSFDPESFKENKFIPPVYITRLTVFNQEVGVNQDGSPLKKSIVHTDKIELPYNRSNIGFDFAALSFTDPSANRYAYKMEGIDADWIYTIRNHSATYAKLPPGKYIFKVRGSNNDGFWNETGASIEIVIKQPWWNSAVARIIYFILFAFLVYYLIRWYKKRNLNRKKLFEAEKEKELYTAKLDFFTEIAHEIKTPVSLITGPLEVLREMNSKEPEVAENLDIMSKNTSRLLQLINQLLDFRKADSQKLGLRFSEVDISEAVSDTYKQFEKAAKRDKRTMQLCLPQDPVIASVDKEEFTKILNNLFSNAIKYSSSVIDVVLKADNDAFSFIIQNDGELLPFELHEKIFEPFYRLEKDRIRTGSGIGLSLVRSLTDLHHGTIRFEIRDNLNSFVLRLPLHRENKEKENTFIEEDILGETDSETDRPINDEYKKTVLIVEDHEEMRTFVSKQLIKQFNVEQAESPAQAFEILKDTLVDIIVSDVMMPGMNGFEFCKKLKSDIEYSHIPIVLLTAKNDLSGKIQGLESGAEAYVEKPFSPGFLIAQLVTLLNNRNREREAFRKKPFIPHRQMGMTKEDEKFMDKLVGIITQNIADDDLNVDQLSETMFMSRSSFHRKIKALTDLTPAEFIRLIRLKKAAELIQSGEYRISEVGYMVGINSPSHFTKLFHRQFGVKPKDFGK